MKINVCEACVKTSTILPMKFCFCVCFVSTCLGSHIHETKSTPPRQVYDLRDIESQDFVKHNRIAQRRQRVTFWRGSHEGQCPRRCLNEALSPSDMDSCIAQVKRSGLPCFLAGKLTIRGTSGIPECETWYPFGLDRFVGIQPPVPSQVEITILQANVTFHLDEQYSTDNYCRYALSPGAMSECGMRMNGLKNFSSEDVVETMLKHQYIDFQADKQGQQCSLMTVFDYESEARYEVSIGNDKRIYYLINVNGRCSAASCPRGGQAMSLQEVNRCVSQASGDEECFLKGKVWHKGSGHRTVCEGNHKDRGRSVIEVSPVTLPKDAWLTDYTSTFTLHMDSHHAIDCDYEIRAHPLGDDGYCSVEPQPAAIPFLDNSTFVLVSSSSTMAKCGYIKDYEYIGVHFWAWSASGNRGASEPRFVEQTSKKGEPWIDPHASNRQIDDVLLHLDHRSVDPPPKRSDKEIAMELWLQQTVLP